MQIYHVAKNGNDANNGSENAPFLTICAAVNAAKEGDTVLVHAGEYREWVSPERSGVTFLSAEEGKAVIKGSEPWDNWEKQEDGSFRAVIPNCFFGENNPFAERIEGDWFRPMGREHHTGMVYANGEALFEAKDRQELFCKPSWYAEVGDSETTVWANFGASAPAHRTVEINVRKYCFFPRKTGVDRITVKGFRMCHAATNWAPPTARQEGLLGPHWSYGWVIENNIIHDARCVGISLGKEESTGQNPATYLRRKPGFNYQLEVVFKALRAGWKKGKIGSHTVKNNVIHSCGQAGIVGHMGCAFSTVSGNRIYNIHQKEAFAGAEIACIKFHAALDVIIENNRLHDCDQFGIWLDWQNQGARLSRNLFYRNGIDLFMEVCHGPCLVDNNLFLSQNSLQLMAQGAAFAHNVFAGRISSSDVLARSTPYHFPHETDVMGTEVIFGGDDRFYNNVFYGPAYAKETVSEEKAEAVTEAMGNEAKGGVNFGLLAYRAHPLGEKAYRAAIRESEEKIGVGLLSTHRAVKQPVYAASNVYFLGAHALAGEENAAVCPDFDAAPALEETETDVYFTLTVNQEMLTTPTERVTSARLGTPRFPEAAFENPDGTPLSIDRDFFGNLRSDTPTVGAFEHLSAGINRIKL